MPTEAGAQFILRMLPPSLVDATVLEVGSRRGGAIDMRDLVAARHPRRYLGLDVQPGPGVDVVGTVERLTDAVGENAADVVVAAEVMEHVPDWRAAILEMKRGLRPGGRLIFTTRSPGYPFHVSPFDYWRYTLDDAWALMADMVNVVVEDDPLAPGVFVAATKPMSWRPADFSNYRLVSILTKRRELGVRQSWVWRKKLSSPRRIVSALLPIGVKSRIWASLPAQLRDSLARRPPMEVPAAPPIHAFVDDELAESAPDDTAAGAA